MVSLLNRFPSRILRLLLRSACLAPLGILLVLAFCAPASNASQQKKQGMPRAARHEYRLEIEKLEDLWRNAILNANVQVLEGLLADDYMGISANGTLQSKDQTLDNLRDGKVRFQSLSISDRKVRFYGKTAVVTSQAEVKGNAGDGDISGGFRFTRVYVRDQRGAWKVVSFEASRIRPVVEPPQP